MKSRYVTEPDYPLRILLKCITIQLVEEMHCSITSTAAKYGSHLGIIEGLVYVGETLADSAAERSGSA